MGSLGCNLQKSELDTLMCQSNTALKMALKIDFFKEDKMENWHKDLNSNAGFGTSKPAM
jgi:hypothetical protein